MIKKIGGFLENHVEKIILIVVGLLCTWLLITRVLLTPNVIEYRGKSYSPGNLDDQIYIDAREAKKKNPDAHELIPPDNRNYAEMFSDPLGEVNFEFLPKPEKPAIIKITQYPTPDINKIKIANVDIEYIRSVVYEPVSEISKSKPYVRNISEPNDLDFVSVSGKLDIKSIVDEYKKCYIDGVSKELADPCKAKPVFAQVNLQRQRLLSNGQWSGWENVSRAKIDENKEIFKYTDSYSDLSFGGIEIYKYQLNHTITQLELLQPKPYEIATANEEWLPPELYRKFKDAQKKDERDARIKEAAKTTTTSSTTSDTGGRRRDRTTTGGVNTTTTQGTRRGGQRNTDINTNTSTTNRRGRGTTTQEDTSVETTRLFVDDVYDDYESVILTVANDLTKISEPILFWAFDDTVQPKNTYRYRIRVGLLNPTADSEDDDLIFWSSFSDVTSEVAIPGKMYFFAGEVQEAAKTVSVSVSKLHLGYWYKKVFDRVAPGEMIGGIADIESKEPKEAVTTGRITETTKEEKEIITVDFTTGAVMVDVERVSELAGGSSISPVPYHNMLYTYDGKEILKMPATRTPNSNIWPLELYQAYNYVQSHINDKYEKFNSWGAGEIDIDGVRIGEYSERSSRY